MAKIEGFAPEFLKSATNGSYRQFYKWGNKDRFYAPSQRSRLYSYVRDKLGLKDEYFKEPNYACDSVVVDKPNTKLDNKDVDKFRDIVGEENVHIDLDNRIKASITKNAMELKNMHNRVLPAIVDAVVCPSHEKEIIDILAYAKKRKINVVIASSLIPKAVEKKCIAIDLRERYNKISEFNEVDSYVTAEAGIYLPILENIMNNAPDNFKDYNVENKFTIGHFPLEYEECTLYDADNGVKYGKEAGYYGSFDDIVMQREYVTAEGKVDTFEEGAVLTKLKLKLVKSYPHNKYGFSYMFRNWQEAVNALREIYSRNTALPVHIKLSDPNETNLLMRYYMVDDTPVDSILKMYKCKDDARCLLVGFSGGAYTYSRLAFNLVRKIAKKYKAVSMTSFVADAYDDSRYAEMYVREAVADFGMSSESEFIKLNWSEIPEKYNEIISEEVRGYNRARIIAGDKNSAVLEVVRVSID